MPWRVQLTIERTGVLLPSPERARIETCGPTPLAALAHAVVGMMPSVHADLTTLFHELRAARNPESSPPGKAA